MSAFCHTAYQTSHAHHKCMVALAALVLLGAFGCTTHTRKFQPAQNVAALDDTSFLHYLATVPVVTIGEACRAWMMVLDESSRAQWTHVERQMDLERREILNPAWKLEEDNVLDKGTLAFMVRQTCDLSRSPTERLAALVRFWERRYALKTCVHEGLMRYGTSDEAVTGGELLSVMTKVEEFLEARREELLKLGDCGTGGWKWRLRMLRLHQTRSSSGEHLATASSGEF